MAHVLDPVAVELERILRPHGFRRVAWKYLNSEVSAVVRQIAIEKFRWNAPGMHRFRLLLKLYLATGAAGEFVFPSLPGRYSLVLEVGDGIFRDDESAFHLLPPDPADPAFLAGLRAMVEQDVLPFLDRATSLEGVVAPLEEASHRAGRDLHTVPLAIALARLGRTEESRFQFRRAAGDPEAVRAVAKHHGIDVDN